MDTSIGLRERKKQQTKAALTASAYKLFKKQGYYLTTIEDIASGANFAPRTFFLHFSSKEDLLFPEADSVKASLQAAMDSRGNTPTLRALEQWIRLAVAQKQSQNMAEIQLRTRIIAADKLLQARERMYLGTIEEVLVAELAKDLQLSQDDLAPKLTAAAAIAVFSVVDAHANHLADKKADAHVDTAMAFLLQGLAAIR